MIGRALAAVLILAAAEVSADPALVFDARVVWRSGDVDFGGMSGLEVLDDGARVLAISDRGHWASADLIRENGMLTEIRTTGFGPLREISGAVLDGENVDAEGLAIDPAGNAVVSFEAFHRIRRYATIDGPAEEVPSHRDFAKLQNNSALEALATDADGVIYAIPERSGRLERPFPVYRFRDGRWDKKLRVPRRGPFLVVGADIGPDGDLWILERDFRWAGGFANRIRRFTLTPSGLEGEVTLLETALGSFDNMEGISVWRDAMDETRVTLISDDNFFALQQTVLAEYVLEPGS